jgi:SAM-dependent methyltransferase
MFRLSTFFYNNGVKRILDLGCGTGRHLTFLSRSGFDVSGFDSSKTALDLALKWLNEEGLVANIHLGRMEEPLPYPDDNFDAVISIQVIHHNLIQDIVSTVTEIERILTTDGFIFISVPVLDSTPEKPEDDWKLEQVEEGTFIPQVGPESGVPHHYFTEQELHGIFKNFKILEMYLDDTKHRCILATKRN